MALFLGRFDARERPACGGTVRVISSQRDD
jgi:hypothetical protein